jgi:hypothetical protein
MAMTAVFLVVLLDAEMLSIPLMQISKVTSTEEDVFTYQKAVSYLTQLRYVSTFRIKMNGILHLKIHLYYRPLTYLYTSELYNSVHHTGDQVNKM